MSPKGVALVTGAAEDLEEVVNELKLKGCKTSAHVADVSIDEQVRAMVEAVVKEYGSLDVMVANAGIVMLKPLLDTTENDWDKVFAVNAKGTFLCYKYAGAQMIAQGRGGRIIGASSVSGKRGSANMGAYSGTKFAIRGLTQTAAVEFGPHGITVNAYAPGPIETALLQQLDDENVALTQGKSGDFVQFLSQRAPVGFNGNTADVAGLVSFLASKESRFITGIFFD
ncbi:acetoin reductase family protein [Lyophyllum atratum]|nr:acetoin reductase family protein [Lyophyllum atratum]